METKDERGRPSLRKKRSRRRWRSEGVGAVGTSIDSAILRVSSKSAAYQLTVAVLLADLHAQERDADAREGARRGGCTDGESWRRRCGRTGGAGPDRRWTGRDDRRERGKAAPVPAMPQVVLQQPPARPAHQGPHRRETVQMQLLRPQVQAAQSRTAAHPPAHG